MVLHHKDNEPQRGRPSNPPEFASDSVLNRLMNRNYQPTDADREELQKLAQTGNRAERRAVAKHMKKHGIAAPPAAPRQPIVAPEETAEPSRHAPARAAVKKTAAKKAAAKKIAVKKTAAKKTAAKKTAAKKTPVKKTAAKKTAAKKTAVKKTAAKKTVKKRPAK